MSKFNQPLKVKIVAPVLIITVIIVGAVVYGIVASAIHNIESYQYKNNQVSIDL